MSVSYTEFREFLKRLPLLGKVFGWRLKYIASVELTTDGGILEVRSDCVGKICYLTVEVRKGDRRKKFTVSVDAETGEIKDEVKAYRLYLRYVKNPHIRAVLDEYFSKLKNELKKREKGIIRTDAFLRVLEQSIRGGEL